MTAPRKLSLKKETLSDLTTVELRGVVGGAPSGTTCPVKACLDSDYNCLIKWPTKEGCTPYMIG
jgi:hypothetical protein